MTPQSLVIWRDLDDRQGEGQTLFNLGDAFDKRGDRAHALAPWREALTKLHPDSP